MQLVRHKVVGSEPKLSIKLFAFRLLNSLTCEKTQEQHESHLNTNNERRITTTYCQFGDKLLTRKLILATPGDYWFAELFPYPFLKPIQHKIKQ